MKVYLWISSLWTLLHVKSVRGNGFVGGHINAWTTDYVVGVWIDVLYYPEYSNTLTLKCVEGCENKSSIIDFFPSCINSSEAFMEDFFGEHCYIPIDFPMSSIVNNTITISIEDSSWISPISEPVSLKTSINLAIKDTGPINNPPYILIDFYMPTTSYNLTFLEGLNHTLIIPVYDDEGDTVRCRWAQGYSECGGVCDNFGHAVLNEENCIISFEAIHGSGSWAAAIMIEDFLPGESKPHNSVGYQFLVNVYSTDAPVNSSVLPTEMSSTSEVNKMSTYATDSTPFISLPYELDTTSALSSSTMNVSSTLDKVNISLNATGSSDTFITTITPIHGSMITSSSTQDSASVTNSSYTSHLTSTFIPTTRPPLPDPSSVSTSNQKRMLKVELVNPLAITDSNAIFEWNTNKPVESICRLDFGKFLACADMFHANNLTEGDHFLFIGHTDIEGNVVNTTHLFYVDLTPPVTTFINTPSRFSNEKDSTIFFLCNDIQDDCTYYCDFSTIGEGNVGNYSLCLGNRFTTPLLQNEKEYILSVFAIDTAGNIGKPSVIKWIVDLTPPNILANSVNIDCIAYNSNGIDFPIILDNIDQNPSVTFVDRKISCAIVRTWIVTDLAGNRNEAEITITLSYTPSFEFLPVITSSCSSAEDRINIPSETAHVLNPCHRSLDFSHTDNPKEANCPDQINRTWVLSDSCSGQKKIAHQMITLFDICPVDACGQNFSEPRGFCSQGQCLCKQNWYGESCDTLIYEPKIGPVEETQLLEYEDFIADLTLLQGSPPVTWMLLTAPERTVIEYDTGRIILKRAQAGNHTFKVTATNHVGKYEITIKLAVSSTYRVLLNTLNETIFPKAQPIILAGSIEFDEVSPIREILKKQVPIEIDVYNELSGSRKTLRTFSDKEGIFSTYYYPSPNEYGLYYALVRHPSDIRNTFQIEWKTLGMKTFSKSLKLDGETMGPYQRAYVNITTLVNDGPGDLHNIQSEPIPDFISEAGINVTVSFNGKINHPELKMGSSASISIDLETSGAINAKFFLTFKSEEGVYNIISIEIDVRQILPIFHVEPFLIRTSVLQGDQKSVDLQITNHGKLTAENISLTLPMSNLFTLISLGVNEDTRDNATLILESQETITASILITVPYDQPIGEISGNFILKSDHASKEVPFLIFITSDTFMNFTLIVEDEYTYFAEGNPLVAGATVTLMNNPRNFTMKQSTLNDSGSTTFINLQEDRYEILVEASEHETIREIITTSIATPTFTIFLRRQTVIAKFSVVPTEVKDTYDIVYEVDFQVNVPVPILSISPTKVDLKDFKLGLKEIVEFNITNHGFIRAENVALKLPSDHPLLSFNELSYIPHSLEAKESIIIQVSITRKRRIRKKKAIQVVLFVGQLLYAYYCNVLQNRTADFMFTDEKEIQLVGSHSRPRVPYVLYSPSSGSSGSSGMINVDVYEGTTFEVCDKCLVAAVGCLPLGKSIPKRFDPSGCALLIASGTNPFKDNSFNIVDMMKYLACFSGGVMDYFFNCFYDVINECLYKKLLQPLIQTFEIQNIHKKLRQTRTETPEKHMIIDFLTSAAGEMDSIKALLEIFGDELWISKGDPHWTTNILYGVFDDSSEYGSFVSPKELQTIKHGNLPIDVTPENVDQLLNRFNETLRNWQDGKLEPSEENENVISYTILEEIFDNITKYNEIAKGRGFSSYVEAYRHDIDKLSNIQNIDEGDGVCAVVRIRLNQRTTLTREGFIATLELENREKTPLENVKVEIIIENRATFEISTKKFSVGHPDVTGSLTGVDGNGTLQAGTSGKAEWLMIPYSEAALTTETLYDIGGDLTYSTGEKDVLIPFLPTTITVQPDPSLVVNVFWEKYVISDDPFTKEIENPVPFLLAVAIKNDGHGIAKDMKISSGQPQIIDNEKGLPMSFKIIKSSVGNEDASPKLTVDFGDIHPNETKVARWWMTASLMGKFIRYNATFENKNPLGDPKLSLINNFTIHELIQNVRISGNDEDYVLDFLVNDKRDPYQIPDTLYSSSDMSTKPVHKGVITSFKYQFIDGKYLLELETSASSSGWHYFAIEESIFDNLPVGKSSKFTYKEERSRRSNVATLPKENAWISVDVMRKARTKSINIVDFVDGKNFQSSYVIEFCDSCSDPLTGSLITDVTSSTTVTQLLSEFPAHQTPSNHSDSLTGSLTTELTTLKSVKPLSTESSVQQTPSSNSDSLIDSHTPKVIPSTQATPNSPESLSPQKPPDNSNSKGNKKKILKLDIEINVHV